MAPLLRSWRESQAREKMKADYWNVDDEQVNEKNGSFAEMQPVRYSVRKPTHLEGACIIPSSCSQRRQAALAASYSSLRGERDRFLRCPGLPSGSPLQPIDH